MRSVQRQYSWEYKRLSQLPKSLILKASAMKPRRYFCYGVLFTSVIWACIIFLYHHLDSKLPQNASPNSVALGIPRHHLRFRPRHNIGIRHDGDERRDGLDRAGVQGKDAGNHGDSFNNDLARLAVIRTPEDQKTRDEGYRSYAFNQLISDRLPYNRTLPDTRNKHCKSKVYPEDLPTASVIICFYNEAWSALLRTAQSAINRTPPHLLHEVILVDDSSDLDHLGEKLEIFVKEKLTKVKLIRTPQRQGLIRARIYGADHARGEVLIFLDSHCEVNVNWAQPLLAQVKEDRKNVAIPIIDIINQDTFAYEPSPLVRGGFNWGMHFRWDPIPQGFLRLKEDYAKPIKSPTMAGGLFAMDRQYFTELGKYDPGMDVWGGENLEISFRVWQCGGRLDIIPCSRVGHVFRKRRPYGSPTGDDTMTKNSLRVANVWMDEYKMYYFKVRPDAKIKSFGDITDRIALRKRLECKSFKWYLDNVYPEQTLPSETGGGLPKGMVMKRWKQAKASRKGWLRHYKSRLCLVSDGRPYDKRTMLRLTACDQLNDHQVWSETEQHELLLINLLCLDGDIAAPGRVFPRLMKCHGQGGSQEWRWTALHHRQLLNPASGKCLAVVDAKLKAYASLEVCDDQNPDQQFEMRGFL